MRKIYKVMGTPGIYSGRVYGVTRGAERRRYYVYYVKKGDTLMSIAYRFNTNPNIIRMNNRLKSTELYEGQRLWV